MMIKQERNIFIKIFFESVKGDLHSLTIRWDHEQITMLQHVIVIVFHEYVNLQCPKLFIMQYK